MTENTAVTVVDPAAEITAALTDARPELAGLLGVDETSARGRSMLDRFYSVALHAAVSDPKILRATRESVIQAIRDSALLGLEPVGMTGDGAIVVYDERVKVEKPGRQGGTIIVQETRPTAHFQPMYRGLLKLARRSDELVYIDAHVAYENDELDVELGSNPYVRHKPLLGGERGQPSMIYAVAETRDGRRYVDVMTVAEIEVTRKASRGGSDPASPWVKFWSEMARKTVLRRMMKRLPLETTAEHALRLENETEATPVVAALPPGAGQVDDPAEARRRRLRAKVGAKDPELPAPSSPAAAEAEPSSSEPTNQASDQETAASVDPTGAEVEGEVREVCGAESDPQLGAIETCLLAPGHSFPDGKPSPHESKEGSKWPNR